MTVYSDISNWDETLRSHGLALLMRSGLFSLRENPAKVSIAKHAREWACKLMNDPVMAHLHWIGISLGIECLLKAVLLKHQCLDLRNRALETRPESAIAPYDTVYRTALSTKVIAKSNPWLQRQLISAGIESLWNINSHTIGTLIQKFIPRLTSIGVITKPEEENLTHRLITLTDIRRNVDAHVFLKLRVIMSIGHDLEKVIVPVVNQLLRIWDR
ncbi:MAG: hypothetical protein H0Z30_04610 [Candidatus Marinimicrobia bacterium]|nr:hypothetical protein [Candidatus Neomarinimicrobiota bacterium]